MKRKTREVNVGKVGIGGKNPIRIQSMTTSPTDDIEATVLQIIKLADSGCEIVRVTVQGMKEAKACEQIKNHLIKKGYEIPLVADIHFYPPAALYVIDFVDKIRINPGNYFDRRAIFQKVEYDEISYRKELEKIESKFAPLVEKCLQQKKAMRIGVNHGSLSDRIMNRYGDTPLGMVESAFEFAHICRNMGFHNFLFSMKSSNPIVMVHAYRLLQSEMGKIEWDYPLHLGVTEAGEGIEGRIKSAAGIGALLLDGIGDTIRVSLTEDPWNEIDPCKRLIDLYEKSSLNSFMKEFERRQVSSSPIVHRDGSVILTATDKEIDSPSFFEDIGCSMQFKRPIRELETVDAIIYDSDEKKLPRKLEMLKDMGVEVFSSRSIPNTIPLIQLKDPIPISSYIIVMEFSDNWDLLISKKPECILFKSSFNRLQQTRSFFDWAAKNKIEIPILLHFEYIPSWEDLMIHASAECGAILIDKLAEGLSLTGNAPLKSLHKLSFALLQAVRMRTTKTEFISCPGCGRTLFDLQQVSERIRNKTSHLPGVKIAIMGCIVNGPGEMADADFGYVGSKRGKVDLYIGKQCVEKNIDFEHADERLIELIKSEGKWVDQVEQSIS